MHGLIFETSVWLLAESTRLLNMKRIDASSAEAAALQNEVLSDGSQILKQYCKTVITSPCKGGDRPSWTKSSSKPGVIRTSRD